ncbi:MAG: hypothetical protein LHV68_07070 [Elusimicrobia bacterium]|nr:hypothetical protein [Candidatus Liberimonas magnetica]
MNKMQIKFYHSYKEADADMLKDSLLMKPEERVAAMNAIRKRVYALKGIKADNEVIKTISYGKR